MAGASLLLAGLLLGAAAAAWPLYVRYRAWRYPPEYSMRIYDARDFIVPRPNLCGGEWLPLEPVIRGAPPTLDESWPQVLPPFLEDVVKQDTGLDNWQNRQASIQERNGQFVVFQLPDMHDRVARAIEKLRREAQREVSVEAVFLKGPALPGLLAEAKVVPGQVLPAGTARALIASAARNGIQAVRPTRVGDLCVYTAKELKEATVRCSNGRPRRLSALETRDLPGVPEGRSEQVHTGFVLDIQPAFPGPGPTVDLQLRASYCALLSETPAADGLRPLDERSLQLGVTVPAEGWAVLILPSACAPAAGPGASDPVVVLVGVRPTTGKPDEKRRRL